MLGGVEVLKDIPLAHAHGLEQNGGGHFAAAVNADVEDVLVVKVKIQPGAAHGDNPAGVEHLAAGVRFAAVVLKNDAGRTLELVDDDPLCAVDDKSAFFGHQGQGAEIDILLLDVADGAVARGLVRVVDYQAHLDAHGGLVGQAFGNALGLVVLGLAHFVVDELQTGSFIKVFNGENGTEHAFQALVGLAVLYRQAFLKEFLVGIYLQVEQMGDREGNLDFAELFGELAHGYLK